jgi:hypothetical protein
MTRGSGDGGASLCSAFAGAASGFRGASRSRGACQPNANPRPRLRRIEQQFNGYRVRTAVRPGVLLIYPHARFVRSRTHAAAGARPRTARGRAGAGRGPRAARESRWIPAAPGGYPPSSVLAAGAWRRARPPPRPPPRGGRRGPRSRARRVRPARQSAAARRTGRAC